MQKKSSVIGLTGQIASGKSEVANTLTIEFGFTCYSLSDRVREMAAFYRETVTRKILQSIGDEMRHMMGGDIFARLTTALVWAEAKNRVVIDGIRNPSEVEFLKKHPHFVLIAVLAPREIRFERMKARARPSDPKTLEEFVALDDRDMGVGHQDKLGQQVGRCITMADYVLENNGTIETFQSLIWETLKKKGV